MDIKELAATFIDTRERRDLQEAYVNVQLQHELRELEANSKHTVESNLRVIKFKSEIQASQLVLDELNKELDQVVIDLKPLLKEAKTNFHDPLHVHVEDTTWFAIWVDENDEIQSPGLTTKL